MISIFAGISSIKIPPGIGVGGFLGTSGFPPCGVQAGNMSKRTTGRSIRFIRTLIPHHSPPKGGDASAARRYISEFRSFYDTKKLNIAHAHIFSLFVFVFQDRKNFFSDFAWFLQLTILERLLEEASQHEFLTCF